jgi:hypothetical protein
MLIGTIDQTTGGRNMLECNQKGRIQHLFTVGEFYKNNDTI